MEYKDIVRDFAMRTAKNLELIEKMRKEDPCAEVFEVTQLVNSMLGLLVFPQQKYFNKIEKIPLAALKAQGWPIPEMKGCPPYASDLRELMRCLRNGISHFDLEFISHGGVLTGLKVWNCLTDEKGKYVKDDSGHRIKVWEAKLGLHELREIARRFIRLLLDFQPVEKKIGRTFE